uniref:Trehalase n=1 Tax=Timema monikensis TaxID=170555 RepID=A0A7R9E1T3_9NEOP|nr:unnamed protein product [Timema monikensis]
MNITSEKPTQHQVKTFIEEMFEPAGTEFEDWEPPDWLPNPPFLLNIQDLELREWGRQLNNQWKFLGRNIKEDVRVKPDHYSLIYVPYPVIVPGGRFREFYYWDSYWIVGGLLYSEMHHTVKGMLLNFLSIVDKYGFIPNGGRIYYSARSQPPLLIPMVKSYVDKVKDYTFLKESIHTMEKEFQYWMNVHSVNIEKNGKTYRLARYFDASSGPRPESYKEDVQSARLFKTDAEREDFYSELKAATESGWDFSSRWFVLNATNKGNITNLKTKHIIPVDLNAILYWNANILAEFFTRLGNTKKSLIYKNIAKEWLDAVTEILWHDEVGAWLDYDIMNGVKRDYFYPTNISPLWTGCFVSKAINNNTIGKVMKYLEKHQIMVNLGGVPASLEHTGEQWDYPNAWAPLQYMMVHSLEATGDETAKELAFQIAEKWVRSNYKAYNETNAMYEKYDATVPGGHGGGGEYTVQLGFGWTNGVVMAFLDMYGDRLTVGDTLGGIAPQASTGCILPSSMTTIILSVVALLLPLFIGCMGVVAFNSRKQYILGVKFRKL